MGSLKLNALIVGEDTVFSVDIGSFKTVHDLERIIKREQQYESRAAELHIYRTWLQHDDIETAKLKNPAFHPVLRDKYLSVRKKLEPSLLLSQFYDATPALGYIHILVDRPRPISGQEQPPKTERPGFVLTHRAVDPTRVTRWNSLNKFMAASDFPREAPSRFFKQNGFGRIKWETSVPEEPLNVLSRLLHWMITCSKFSFDASGSDRDTILALLVSPIFGAVVELLPDTQVAVNQAWRRIRVNAERQFDFVLTRGAKRACIKLVRSMQTIGGATTDALLGCEVLCDVDSNSPGSDEICAVVTTFSQWVFLTSTNAEILCDEGTALTAEESNVSQAQLCQVVGKITSLLM